MKRAPWIKELGTLDGPLLIFGGVYGNLQALERMKLVAEEVSISPANIICTGDIAGYCAQPAECLSLIRSWGIHAIAGNVEIQLREDAADCGCEFNEGSRCDIFSRAWYPYTQARVTTELRNWLHELPDQLRFVYGGRTCAVIHGTFDETAGYIFESSPWAEKQRSIDASGADLILAGHSGLPFVEQNGTALWLNAGVIGMPANDGQPGVWYARIEMTDGVLQIRRCRLDYDYQTAAAKMRAAFLPEPYAATLISGIWDNCEILPDAETALQGRPIVEASVWLK